MKKRIGTCTEDIFWECVSEIGWNDASSVNTGQAKRACLVAWTPEFGNSFREILGEKEGEVSRCFAELEKRGLSADERDEYYLGGDGFGDLCSHVVGLGRETFEDELRNPRKLFERVRDSKYQEKFSYCIPYEANPQTTWEKWVEMHAPDGNPNLEAWEEKWEQGGFGCSDETFEDYLERSRRQHLDHQLGDWAYMDAGHYAPLAKRYHRRSAALVAHLTEIDSPTADEQNALGFAALLMHYFGALVDGETEKALEASEEALRAWWGLHYIDEDLRGLRRSQADLLPMSDGLYGGENTINDHRIYMGGLKGFSCRAHYDALKRSDAFIGRHREPVGRMGKGS